MSADEIDAELLALAGDSSGDEADDLDPSDINEDASASKPFEDSPGTSEPAPSRLRGVAQKVKPRGRRRRRRDSHDQDIEASLSPARSLQSDGLESDGQVDSSTEHDADAPLFPFEGKFTSTDDREYIMSLPEIEREEILADRAQQVIRRQQDLQLRKALADTKATASRNKRSAGAAEFEEESRRSTRPKTDRRSALDDYRRAREQKGAERNRFDSTRNGVDAHSPSPTSDRDADGESEVEWADPSSTSRHSEPPAELKDFERCRVGRSNFAKVCFYPGFEAAIKGCLCRVSVGVHKETGHNQYRMAQIRDFTEGKPYQLETSAGKFFTTDQYAIVAQGAAEKPWPFSACSDGKFTEAELTRFLELSQKDGSRVPSRKFLNTKLSDIHKLLNQVFTEESLQLKFARQRAMERKYDPAFSQQRKRENIEFRRREAELSHDAEEVLRCDVELAELETTIPNRGDSTPQQLPPSRHVLQDQLARLNMKNRGKNIQEVRRALIEERKRLQRDREAATARKEAGARPPHNLVKGRSVEAGSHNDTSDKHASTAPLTDSGLAKTSTDIQPGKRQLGALKKKNLDDDIIGSLDLGIDLEI